jgi:hypothetical protein
MEETTQETPNNNNNNNANVVVDDSKKEEDLRWSVLGLPKWMDAKKFEKLLKSNNIAFQKVKKVPGQNFAQIRFEVRIRTMIIDVISSERIYLQNKQQNLFWII